MKIPSIPIKENTQLVKDAALAQIQSEKVVQGWSLASKLENQRSLILQTKRTRVSNSNIFQPNHVTQIKKT